VHAANVQDHDGGALLMSTLFGLFSFLLKLYADSGYPGPKFQQELRRVCRQIDKDCECLNRSALTFLRWASIRLTLRSPVRKPNDPGWTLRTPLAWDPRH
jgi:hypothetical protein